MASMTKGSGLLTGALLIVLSTSRGSAVVIRPDGTPDLTACSCVPPSQCIPHPFLPTSDIEFTCPTSGHMCCVPDSIVVGTPVCECSSARCSGQVSGKCPNSGEFCCEGASPPATPSPPPPPTPPPATPRPVDSADCTTAGTPRGRCVLYTDCRDRLVDAERRLSTVEYVTLYGCGLNSEGQFQVCCPLN
ncbi:leucine-rich repeat extensin-like protein 5 [Penaeus japonicus]|uniref:leucine-rich repeat extensin-like protein 5 n=1 Tax=Penaeus japonicus TaxID=27405 RepID=UPI001C711C95|nr:leucine-rich repeat extensin-like protein 5 [Penaeus japonicus]